MIILTVDSTYHWTSTTSLDAFCCLSMILIPSFDQFLCFPFITNLFLWFFFNCQLISLICFGFKLILWLTWINDTRQKSRWEKGKILKVCHFKRLGYWRWNTLFCNVKQNKHLVQWNPADDLNCAMRNKDEMELSGELHWFFFYPTNIHV